MIFSFTLIDGFSCGVREVRFDGHFYSRCLCLVSPTPHTEAERAEAEGICPERVFTFPQGWKKAGEDAAAYIRAGGAEEAAGLVREMATAVLSWL